MDYCLSRETIERYVQRLCSESEAQAVGNHLAACERCQRCLESARGGQPAGVRTPPPTGEDPLATQPLPTPGEAPSRGRVPPSIPDVTFEGYQIIEELPQGGQAVVYKAVQKATKAKVALKVLLPGLVASPRARRYFEQEVELAASLNHPNIVSIRDSGLAQGQYYFAMNYIHGQPLDRYVEAQNLSVRDKLVLFDKICDAMAHAHQRGVIHRDLKPSNILVDERREPHILDFGLAKTAAGMSTPAESANLPTLTGQIKGTIAYMSPEQAAGRSDLVDVRTDVYSLGVVLYQMCTGKLPYDISGALVEALRNIQQAEPARPRHVMGRCDSDVEAIVLKCLAKDPVLRYQSAAELRQDVQRWLTGLPIMAKSVSSIYLLRKIASRHRYTAGVLAALLVILCSFAYTSFYLYQNAEKARRETERIARQWSKESTKQLAIYRQLTFRSFLDVWQSPDPIRSAEAASIGRLLASGSPEKRGANFLLDPSADKKPERLRESLPPDSRWLADLVLAEQCLKRQDRAGARAAYERSLRLLPPGQRTLLREHIEVRLHQLATRGAGTASEGRQDGGEKP